jgi:hypothetical protein
MKLALAATLLTAGLSGCATHWVVDSDVRSFADIAPVPAGASYRFERLPSQQVNEAAQRQLEAMAGSALDGVGLHHDETAPHYSALIGARVTAELSPWVDPWFAGGPWWGPGPGFGGPWGAYGGWRGSGWYGGGWYGPMLPPAANPWYAREVSIVLRELPSNRVVYETHARNEGPYSASADILPVMFQAALQGFPNPPAGEHRVNIEIQTARSRNTSTGSTTQGFP